MSKYVICAGHGDEDPGNLGGGEREADLMDELGHIVSLKLRASGATVVEDGPRGENWPLRRAIGLIQGSTLAVELHTNASSNPKAEGVEVVAQAYLAEPARRIAKAIGSVLQIPLRRRDGWYPYDEFFADRKFTPGFARAGGLIVEVFFQTNPEELRRYMERRWLVGSAIARTILENPR